MTKSDNTQVRRNAGVFRIVWLIKIGTTANRISFQSATHGPSDMSWNWGACLHLHVRLSEETCVRTCVHACRGTWGKLTNGAC